MASKELDEIARQLLHIRERKEDVRRARIQAEVDSAIRELKAYYDGINDAIIAVKDAMERKKDETDSV